MLLVKSKRLKLFCIVLAAALMLSFGAPLSVYAEIPVAGFEEGYPKAGPVQDPGSKQVTLLLKATGPVTASYVILDDNAIYPTAIQVMAGTDSEGGAAIASGGGISIDTAESVITVTLQDSFKDYDAFIVLENQSYVAKLDVRTPVDIGDCIAGCGISQEDGGFSSSETIDNEIYYHIATDKNLAHITKHMDDYTWPPLNYKQVADIDLSENFSEGWTPIGYETFIEFSGNYLGDNHKIEHMSIDLESTSQDTIFAGLFSGMVSSAHIEGINLGIDRVEINNVSGGGVFFGGITGLQDTDPRTIEDCHVTISGDITVTDNVQNEGYDSEIIIGGIAGVNAGFINNCSVTNTENSKVYVGGNGPFAFVGGIAGVTYGEISNSDHTGSLYVEADSSAGMTRVHAGGIAGLVSNYMESSEGTVLIENCQNNGNVDAVNLDGATDENRAYAGGIAGHIESRAYDAFSAAPMELGYNNIVIVNCANVGTGMKVTAKAPTAMAGGVAASSRFIPEASPLILNCYNNSAVSSILIPSTPSDIKGLCIGAASGGIIGAAGGARIVSSYSSAEDVTAFAAPVDEVQPLSIVPAPKDDGYAGGIAGLIYGTDFEQDYYLKNNFVTAGVGGAVIDYAIVPIEDINEKVIGYSSAQLKVKDNFGDKWFWYTKGGEEPQYYDPEKPWRIVAANSYPVLRGKPYTGSNDGGNGDSSGGGGSSAAVVDLQVTFYANDGTNKVIAKKAAAKAGNTIALPEEPAREGYTFIGWNLKENGKGLSFNELYKVDKSMSVYAQWVKNTALANSGTSKYFNDINHLTWAMFQIDDLYEKGVIQGVGNQFFKPDSKITRADFMLMLVRAYGLNVEFKDNFADVPASAYYYNAVGIAKALGIAEGDGSSFRPNDPITRQDAITLAYRTLTIIGFTLDPGNDGHLSQFSDRHTIASYAEVPLATLAHAKVITGSNGKIYPADYTTRAEMAVILYRMLSL